jgi:peptidyl-prolyl cis-trans isomerase SurA
MAAILKLPSRKFLTPARALGAAVLMLAAAAGGGAQAQNVAAFVNGVPITQLDIDQRSKLLEVSSGAAHKAPPRAEVLEELINEKLQIREAKRWGIDPSDADVDEAFASTAQSMQHMNAEQFAALLTKMGVTPQTFRARLRAQLAWQPLVRGRYQSTLEIYDQDILQEMLNKKTDDESAGYDYTLRPILFVVSPGSVATVFEDRKREAEGLRNRFRGCDEGLPFARALNGVVVQPQIVRSSADLPPELRKGLDSIPVGQLTAPEVTTAGVQLFAVCAKDASKADNAAGKKTARATLFAQKFEQVSKRYLQELRRSALIEYK